MSRALICILLLATISPACVAFGALPTDTSEEVADLWTDSTAGWPDDIAGLTKELHRAKLAQIAILIANESRGESGLLLKDGVSANPDVKFKWREEKWGDIPAISVYQASVPVNVQFEGIDSGRIIGAVSLLVETSSPKDKAKIAKPGVYMLYMFDRATLATTGETEMALVSIEVGDKPGWDEEGKVALKEVLRVPGKVVKVTFARTPKKTSDVTVTFPKPKEVTSETPANRASVVLRWDKQTVRFNLDLAITLLKTP